MSGFPVSMRELVAEFSRMPGIGPKSAERLAFYILRSTANDVEKLSRAMIKVKDTIRFCNLCNNLSDS